MSAPPERNKSAATSAFLSPDPATVTVAPARVPKKNGQVRGMRVLQTHALLEIILRSTSYVWELSELIEACRATTPYAQYRMEDAYRAVWRAARNLEKDGVLTIARRDYAHIEIRPVGGGTLTMNQKEKVLAGIRAGAYPEVAAANAGLTYEELGRALAAEDKFRAELIEAQANAEVFLTARIASVTNDWRAQAWLLERRHPERWARKEEKNVNVSGGISIDQTIVSAIVKAVAPYPEAKARVTEALRLLDKKKP